MKKSGYLWTYYEYYKYVVGCNKNTTYARLVAKFCINNPIYITIDSLSSTYIFGESW